MWRQRVAGSPHTKSYAPCCPGRELLARIPRQWRSLEGKCLSIRVRVSANLLKYKLSLTHNTVTALQKILYDMFIEHTNILLMIYFLYFIRKIFSVNMQSIKPGHTNMISTLDSPDKVTCWQQLDRASSDGLNFGEKYYGLSISQDLNPQGLITAVTRKKKCYFKAHQKSLCSSSCRCFAKEQHVFAESFWYALKIQHVAEINKSLHKWEQSDIVSYLFFLCCFCQSNGILCVYVCACVCPRLKPGMAFPQLF